MLSAFLLWMQSVWTGGCVISSEWKDHHNLIWCGGCFLFRHGRFDIEGMFFNIFGGDCLFLDDSYCWPLVGSLFVDLQLVMVFCILPMYILSFEFHLMFVDACRFDDEFRRQFPYGSQLLNTMAMHGMILLQHQLCFFINYLQLFDGPIEQGESMR